MQSLVTIFMQYLVADIVQVLDIVQSLMKILAQLTRTMNAQSMWIVSTQFQLIVSLTLSCKYTIS